MTVAPKEELEVLQGILLALGELDKEAQTRLLETVATYLGLGGFTAAKNVSGGDVSGSVVIEGRNVQIGKRFSEHEEMGPKEFVAEKDPRTSIGRIACLAFYLTHYRDKRHFQTLDLSRLNTEAAQQKFTNATQTVKDAVRAGLFAPGKKGHKQISALGEQYIQALPDQKAAKEVLDRYRKPRRKKKSANKGKARS